MSEHPAEPHDPLRRLPDVPVFNCHVYLAPPDAATGKVSARVATLADLSAEGRNERDALRNIVARFKEVVGDHLKTGEAIPWLPAPLPIAAGETQRFVPVHF